MKENVARPTGNEYIVDDEDSSVTRAHTVFQRLFQRAGATLLHMEQQQRFPADLFPVWMYVLQ